MGGCFSTATDIVASIPEPPRRPWPVIRPTYRTGMMELVLAPAGTRGEADKHTRKQFAIHLTDLQTAARQLVPNLEELRDEFESTGNVRDACIEMRDTLATMQLNYEAIFRLSAWEVDDHVTARKKLATNPYFDTHILRDYLHGLMRNTNEEPNFHFLEDMLGNQLRSAFLVEMNYKANYRDRIAAAYREDEAPNVAMGAAPRAPAPRWDEIELLPLDN